ncbi:MAG: sigma-54 dependent transcriptional regulator, partial [Saprospiraceae bacterium]
ALTEPAASIQGSIPEESSPAIKFKSAAPVANPSGYVVGDSPQAQALYKQIDLVAPTNYSVIIYGESGAGKESIARMIHDRSPRRNQPFVAMDCGAISKDLANSELFGHEKGAFTGALTVKIGHFEMANGGTLFLDEVTNLPYDVQVALLRVVQERRLKRIGSAKEIPLDVRILVASNERLWQACRKGRFREDLYHRFNEFTLEMPPLRERRDDIMLFASRFLQDTSRELGKNIQGFSDDVVQIFMQYPWFGNVRELKNVIKRATLLTDGPIVEAKSLPFEIAYFTRLEMDDTQEQQPENQPIVFTPSSSVAPPATLIAPAPAAVNRPPIPEKTDLKAVASSAEYDMIMQVLQEARFNKSKAAQMLGIDRKTLYNKLKNYNIE